MDNNKTEFHEIGKKIYFLNPEKYPLPPFPATRFQGSKRKILSELASALGKLEYSKPLDMFSGSGVVSLLFRTIGKEVSSNDFMLYSQNTAKVFQTFTKEKIEKIDFKKDLEDLLYRLPVSDGLVSKNYKGIFFIESENTEIDRFCQNIDKYDDFERSLYIYAVGQALTKKRPYNLFHRSNLDMRTKEVKRSFGNKMTWETPILKHAIKCINELKNFKGDISECRESRVTGFNSASLSDFADDYDLIYLDPPYINGKGVSVDYSDFYHFLDGLCDYSLFSSGDERYPHRPVSRKPSAWLKPDTALAELTAICNRWPNATIVFSYRSDGLPVPLEAAKVMSSFNREATVYSAGGYKYALSKTDSSEELIIVSKPKIR